MSDRVQRIRDQLAAATPNASKTVTRMLELNPAITSSHEDAARRNRSLLNYTHFSDELTQDRADLAWACDEIERLRAELASVERALSNTIDGWTAALAQMEREKAETNAKIERLRAERDEAIRMLRRYDGNCEISRILARLDEDAILEKLRAAEDDKP